MILTAEQILKAKDLVTEVVPCPEWGGDVLIRVMTGDDRDQWEREVQVMREKDEPQVMCSRLAVRTLCDEAGAPIFTLEQMSALGDKSSEPLERIFLASAKLNKVGPFRELEAKNSDAPPGTAS